MTRPAQSESPSRSGDLVAPWIVVLAPLLGFAHVHGRGLFNPDMMLLTLSICVAGVGAGVALSKVRSWRFGALPYVLAVAALVLVWIDLQFEADGHFRTIGLVTFPLVWLLRQHGTTILAVTAASLAVTTLLTAPADRAVTEERAAVARSSANLPPILHLVLDEHGGLGALGSAGAAMSRAYAAAGFRLYPRAFSRYSLTANALPNQLNFSSSEQPMSYLGGLNTVFPTGLPENEYFRRLQSRGYRIHVIQPSFLDLCNSATSPVEQCTTVPANSLIDIDNLGYGAIATAVLIAEYWLANESYLYPKARAAFTSAAGKFGRTWSDVPLARVTPSVGIGVLERLESDVRSGPTPVGTAYFAHVFLPHKPYYLESDCSLRRQPIPSDAMSFPGREEAYRNQVACSAQRVLELLDRLDPVLGPDAIVVLHGDHGARLSGEAPPHPLPLDLIEDRYSTLFVVRGPDIEPGPDDALVSVGDLLDHLSRSGFNANGLRPGPAFVYQDAPPRDGPLERLDLPSDWPES